MKQNNYVIINNRAYNPITGLPVDDVTQMNSVAPAMGADEVQASPISSPRPSERGVTMPQIHQTTQRSTTLSRRYVKKPINLQPISVEAEQLAPAISPKVATAPAEQPTVQTTQFSPVNLRPYTTPKSEAVQKFTHQPVEQPEPARTDRPAQAHPIAQRAVSRNTDISPYRQKVAKQQQRDARAMPQAHQTVAQKSVQLAPAQKPAHVIKNEAIYKALQNEVPEKQASYKKQRKQKKGWPRLLSIGTASLAIVMLAGYLTYLSMPNLSVRMAAVQSGVNAKYPGYRPDGYALNGPITFKNGEVIMKFAYAGDDQGFTLTQKRSSWDSSAVKQYVDTKTADATTTTVDGLTIYSYGSDAAWVNSGVLYTVESDAPLSSIQIQRIATSM